MVFSLVAFQSEQMTIRGTLINKSRGDFSVAKSLSVSAMHVAPDTLHCEKCQSPPNERLSTRLSHISLQYGKILRGQSWW